MKKTIFVILLIFIAIIVCIYMDYKQLLVGQNDAKKFNSDFEFYNKESVLGTDITTLINKAINNNEKYNIPKKEDGTYELNDSTSIEIYIYMLISNTTYPMEALTQNGLSDFTKYFGEIEFECTSVKYHESTGKIAEMTFAAKQE